MGNVVHHQWESWNYIWMITVPKWAMCQLCPMDSKYVSKSLLILPSGCLHVLSGQCVSIALWIINKSVKKSFEITFWMLTCPKWAKCQPCFLDCKGVNNSVWFWSGGK